jgi:hypothetical protein
MRKGTVTGDLRITLAELGVPSNRGVYSDPYTKGKVGVKVCDIRLDDQLKEVVKTKMEQKGYTFHFIRENNASYFSGTRFCFSKN